MYRKRRLFYIIMFIFIPCVLLPLIYMAAYFEKFKNGVFNEISFTAETAQGNSIALSSSYDFKNKVYEVKVPIGIELSSVIVNSNDNGNFEINDVIYKNGSVLNNIAYDRQYDIKMITYDDKLLNEASLVFVWDSDNIMMNFDTSDENVNIVSTADAANLPDPSRLEKISRNRGEAAGRAKISVYAKLLTAAFALCWLYLFYKHLKNRGFFVRRRKHN